MMIPDRESFQLAFAGNHFQGTKFVYVSHLLTPEPERHMDEIARSMPQFYYG
ncbi:MAG: hypothetical protein QF733_05495 [Phycisphaerales bacterium]|jgi:hypothetical protein|nr:hypothetical protein [Phycisphaerales bacterium]